MHIALATFSELWSSEVDDLPLEAALRARGAQVSSPAWDDPGVDWAAFDAVLIRTTWNYWHQRDTFLAWTERVGALSRLFNPGAVIRWNTHKGYLRALSARGVRLAPTEWLEPGERHDLPALFAARGWSRGFLKPVVGAGASGTLRFDPSPEGFAAALRLLEGADQTYLLQPYLPKVETEGEVSALYFDGVFSHSVRKIPVKGDFRVQDEHGALDHDEALTPTLRAFTDGVLAAVHAEWPDPSGLPLLYARVDFLFDEAGDPCLTEVELVEPSLFFRGRPERADRLAEALSLRLGPA